MTKPVAELQSQFGALGEEFLGVGTALRDIRFSELAIKNESLRERLAVLHGDVDRAATEAASAVIEAILYLSPSDAAAAVREHKDAALCALCTMFYTNNDFVTKAVLETFKVLGDEAAPAVPLLRDILEPFNRKSPLMTRVKTQVLKLFMQLAPDAEAEIPFLVDLCERADYAVRNQAVIELAALGTNATSALPGLSRVLFKRGQDLWFQVGVAVAMSKIGTSDARVLAQIEAMGTSVLAPELRQGLKEAAERIRKCRAALPGEDVSFSARDESRAPARGALPS